MTEKEVKEAKAKQSIENPVVIIDLRSDKEHKTLELKGNVEDLVDMIHQTMEDNPILKNVFKIAVASFNMHEAEMNFSAEALKFKMEQMAGKAPEGQKIDSEFIKSDERVEETEFHKDEKPDLIKNQAKPCECPEGECKCN